MGDKRDLQDLKRECMPSKTPLTKSYYHGTCPTPLSGDNIGDILHEAAGNKPDHMIFRTAEFDQSITLCQLKEKADKLSRAFLQSGLKQGDIVVLLGVIDIEYYVLFIAIQQIGMIFFYPHLDQPYDVDTKLTCDVQPAAICLGQGVTGGSITAVNEHIIKRFDRKPLVLLQGNIEGIDNDSKQYTDFTKENDNISDNDLCEAKNNVNVDEASLVFTSSGTTSGTNKMVCVTQHFLVNIAIFGHQRCDPFNNTDVISQICPINDDVSCPIQILRIIYNSAVGVMAPSTFTGEKSDQFMDYIETQKITWHCGLPFEFINALDSPHRDKYNLSRLRGGPLVGQIVTTESKQRLLQTFPNMMTAFGSTEALAGLATSTVWSTSAQRVTSCGYPFPHCEVKLVNAKEAIVPIGTQGEICIRGWTVFNKYLNDDKLTRDTKNINTGWYHHGDVGIMDETGHVTYIGRKSECVRFKHFSDAVYPSKILNTIMKSNKVKHAKVVGVHDDIKGDDVCLCVEPIENCCLTEGELKHLIDEEIFENERPDYYFIFDTLPRTGARNKIALKELQSIVEQRLKAIRKS